MTSRQPAPQLRGAYVATAALATALPLLAAAAAIMPGGARDALMALFDPLCHQLPERSFAIAGAQFALCHRCFGVAAGLAAGVWLAPALSRVVRPDDGRGLRTLALAAIPMLIDWGLDVLGAWANTPASRMVTGVVFGIAAGALIAATVAGKGVESREGVEV